MMEGVLVKITLLLLSVTCSSSQDSTMNIIEKSSEIYFTTTGLVSDAFKDDATSKNVAKEIEMSTAELPTVRASTKDPGVTLEKETRSTGGTSVEETSTSSSNELSPTFRLRPAIDLVSPATDLPVTSHENNKTDGHEVTTSHPNNTTMGTSKPVDSKRTPIPSPPPTKKPPDTKPVILIAVCMVILILILIAVIVVLVRNKRRSGSQSFHTQRRSSTRENVWAGQVPDLGDGRMAERPVGMENGAAGSKPENEREMITFISSEKKNDSVEALNETNNGDAQGEQKPLLEDAPQEKDETTTALNVEQELV
ncbi:uncharacterized protein [Phyllobates terribilis]|uniref:uncharacterized protein n=1 Tax=Phyllobates terribilis TaxID=111132 RepID=UPI003CCA6E12